MTKIFAILTLAALVQDDPVVAEALKGFHHPWSEFREGATVTYSQTTRRPEIDNSGNLVMKDVVSSVIFTMGNTDGSRGVVRIESEGRESDFPLHFTPPHWAAGKGERKADEELTVAGKKFVCRVTAVAVDPDKDASETTTIWQNDKAPGWAVRVKNETFARGQRNTWEESVLVAVEEKVKTAEAEVPCYVVEVTSQVEAGNKVVKKEWRSEEVPGRLVRREERHFTKDGREIEAAFTKMEVVRFKGRK